jgi:hypothetical protein
MNVQVVVFWVLMPCSDVVVRNVGNLPQHHDVKSPHSSVGIALGYWLDDRMIGIRIPAGAGSFSLRHRVQVGCGAHPASYPMDTGGCFPGGKVAEAWSWPLTYIQCRGQRMRGSIPLQGQLYHFLPLHTASCPKILEHYRLCSGINK